MTPNVLVISSAALIGRTLSFVLAMSTMSLLEFDSPLSGGRGWLCKRAGMVAVRGWQVVY